MQIIPSFILASGSPRRKALLEQLGLVFEIRVSDVPETFNADSPPSEIVEHLARRKVNAVAHHYPNALTLAADTIVVLDGEILNKPSDEREASHMLRSLSGNRHTVFTGIALSHPASARLMTTSEATQVHFAELDDDEIRSYVATRSPLDKAGAYGIQDDQGALYISRIEGDYYNVVGLPLHRLYRTLHDHFGDLLII
jgi:septum formation protein